MIRPQTCPVCDTVVKAPSTGEPTAFPFCSNRCRQIDFYRWSEGRYAIVEPLDPESIDPEMYEPGDGSIDD